MLKLALQEESNPTKPQPVVLKVLRNLPNRPKFYHLREITSLRIIPRATICLLPGPNDIFYVGAAVCNKGDKWGKGDSFSKKVGRDVALGRAKLALAINQGTISSNKRFSESPPLYGVLSKEDLEAFKEKMKSLQEKGNICSRDIILDLINNFCEDGFFNY